MMAGFFRQIAQRAQAGGGQLHSAAALPYSAARGTREEGGLWSEDASPAPVENLVQRVGMAVPRLSPAQAQAQAQARDAQGKAPGKGKRGLPSPRGKTRTEPRANGRRGKTPRSIVERVVASTTFTPLYPGRPPARQTEVAAPAPAPAIARSAVATSKSAPTARRQKPLKPQVRQGSGRKGAAPAGRAIQPSAPDIHIHIGRVELSANTAAAAAPRREAENARRPMSLDDYLQKRRTARAGAE